MALCSPYYDDGQCVIYCGDCRDILPSLDTGAIDLVLTDPPYGETSLDWDTPVRSWLPLMQRVLAPSGSLWSFGSLRMFMALAGEFSAWHFAQDVVWEKHNGSIFHNDRFRRVHEHVVQFYPPSSRWEQVYKAPVKTMDAAKRTVRHKGRPPHAGEIGTNDYASEDGGPRLMRSVIQARSCHGYADHPTQKPVSILVPIIEYSCPPAGVILDPFMGAGSTLRAAKDLGRRCIGIEIEEKYAEIAVKRLRQSVLPLGAL